MKLLVNQYRTIGSTSPIMPWPCLDATDSSLSFVVTSSIYQAERSS
jgi:hypothetical protein